MPTRGARYRMRRPAPARLKEPPAPQPLEPAHRRPAPALRWTILALALLALAVVGANLVYLAGITNPDPLRYYSGLAYTLGTRYIAGNNYVDPNVGFSAQALGHLAAVDWVHGRVPWWNPFEGLGAPLAGEMQAAAFFPPVLLLYFEGGQVAFRLLLEMAAALSTYLLLRRLVTSRAAAVAGAAAFGLNGTFAWMFHSPANPVAFAPMMILGLEQAREDRRRLAGMPLVAVAVALSIYSGGPEVAYIDGLLAALWFVLRASERRGRELAVYAGRVVAAVGTGVLLAAPLLVAFTSYVQHGDSGAHGSSGLSHRHLAPGLALPSLIMPYVFGSITGWSQFDPTHAVKQFWEGVGGYLGVSVSLLAVVGLAGRTHRRLRLGLGAWVVCAVGRMVGVPLLSGLVNAVPGISATAFYRYCPPSVSLAVILLAAFGIDDMARSRRLRILLPAAALAALATALAWRRAAQIVARIGPAPGKQVWVGLSVAGAFALVLLCVAGGALLRKPRWRAGVLSVLVIVESLGLFVMPEFSTPTGAAIDLGPVRYLTSHMGAGRFVTLGPIEPNYGSYFGISEVNVNESTIAKSFSVYIKTRLDPRVNPILFPRTIPSVLVAHLDGYRAAGVQYLVSSHGAVVDTAPGADLPVVYDDAYFTIRRIPGASPLFAPLEGDCRVLASTASTATVDCPTGGRLSYREQALPGWTASDHGRALRLSAYQSVFQEVTLGPGRHDLRFSYSPPGTDLAVGAFFAGLLLLGAVPVTRVLSRRTAA